MSRYVGNGLRPYRTRHRWKAVEPQSWFYVCAKCGAGPFKMGDYGMQAAGVFRCRGTQEPSSSGLLEATSIVRGGP